MALPIEFSKTLLIILSSIVVFVVLTVFTVCCLCCKKCRSKTSKSETSTLKSDIKSGKEEHKSWFQTLSEEKRKKALSSLNTIADLPSINSKRKKLINFSAKTSTDQERNEQKTKKKSAKVSKKHKGLAKSKSGRSNSASTSMQSISSKQVLVNQDPKSTRKTAIKRIKNKMSEYLPFTK